jgi:uncharacterized protein (TIGR02284 family)
MTFPTQNLAQVHTVNKLNQLFQALQEVKSKYESFAENIKNKQLYQMVISLAVENNQYANELSSLIQSLGGEAKAIESGEVKETGNKIPRTEKTILAACERSEMKLLKVYREVMSENYVYDSLKKMIGYQLNGINFAFHRLKLLKTIQK